MIIKVKNLKENKNLFIDNVEEVLVNSVNDYALAYDGRSISGFPKIKAFKIIQESNNDKEIKHTVNRNVIYGYDKVLFDENIIISQLDCTDKVEDSKTKDTFWSFSELEIVSRYLEGTNLLRYIWLPSVQEVFLLNNNGKTIDRYYR